MNKPVLILALALASSPVAAETYKLYRNSLVEGVGPIHVATFDTDLGLNYDQENCELTRDLFQAQPGVKTHFWCEGDEAGKLQVLLKQLYEELR